MRASRTAEVNRAENIRQRKSKRSTDREVRASKQVRYAAETPTVFVRGGFGTPVVRRTQSKVKRKLAIPMDRPGAEIQMPALPIVRPGWRILSFFLVVLCAGLLYLAYNSPELKVSTPQVDGINRLSPADIDTVAEVSGLPVFMVDPGAVKAALTEAFPELSEISVTLVLPAEVKINVIERQPMLAWSFNGQTIWVDNEGAIFPVHGESATSLLKIESEGPPPLAPDENLVSKTITAEDGSVLYEVDDPSRVSLSHRAVDSELLKGILTLSAQLPENTTLAYSLSEGVGWNDWRGWRVYVGRELDNLNIKMAIYNTIVEQLNQQEIKPALVSVASVNAPYYRME
jgi:cell division septal protein FtsQ